MTCFDPAFHITTHDSSVTTIRSKIHGWITSPWLAELVAMWDGHIPAGETLNATLDYLESFSDKWDFRRIAREQGAGTDDQLLRGQGSARWLSASTGLTPDKEARVIDCATHLGLVHTTSPSQPA